MPDLFISSGSTGGSGTPGASGADLLIHQASGTDTRLAGGTVDSYAFAAGDLDSTDSLRVYIEVISDAQAVQTIDLQNLTDLVSLTQTPHGFNGGGIGSMSPGVANVIDALVSQQQVSPTAKSIAMISNTIKLGSFGVESIPFTTDWNGAWTLGLTFDGIPAGGTLHWKWKVYLLKGTGHYTAGATGATGATGPMGPPGFDGPEGEKGDQGERGLTGPTGLTGLTGPSGLTGMGLPGQDGEEGDQGWPGQIGASGSPGQTGSTGPAGPIGPPGYVDDSEPDWPILVPGSQGSQGSTGQTGAAGVAGPQGPPAQDGDDGDSWPLVGRAGDPAPVADLYDPGTVTFATESYQLHYKRLTLISTDRVTMVGTSEMVLSTFATDTVLILGTPKVPSLSFQVPDGYFLDLIQRLTLSNSVRATLVGLADLILTDDMGTRSRVVLSGRG